MTSRVRWEGIEEGIQKNGLEEKTKSAKINWNRNEETIANDKADSDVTMNKESKMKEVTEAVKLNENPDPPTDSGIKVENVSVENVSEHRLEQESLLKPAKGKQEEPRKHSRCDHVNLSSPSMPTINDRMSLPPFSGQITPIHNRNHAQVHNVKAWREHDKKATVDMLSALYGIIIVVMGIAFPTSQVISIKISSHYYEGFYAYLYFVAIGFFCYIYILLKTQFHISLSWKKRWYQMTQYFRSKEETTENNSSYSDSGLTMEDIIANRLRVTLGKELDPKRSPNHGSFYLRMGAVVFGVGSMIYSGLEFAQYFEMSSNPLCDDIMLAFQPASRMLFTFFQMYFVFLNAKLQIIKNSNMFVARFGMMHLVATNLCVWLNVIIQETKHEMLHFQLEGYEDAEQVADELDRSSSSVVGNWLNQSFGANLDLTHHRLVKRTLSDECHRSDLMGTLTQNASPFLFPCAIEYSLICAAIMYEIWKYTRHDHNQNSRPHSICDTPSGFRTPRTPNSFHQNSQRRSPHHYSVDCTNANKGLFFGIFVLVLNILSMILFFVLINRDDYKTMAITIVHMSELIQYVLTLIAVLIGIIQMNQLRYDASHPHDLDNILLIVALTGVISYNVFTIIGTQFSDHPERMLVLLNALTALVQAIVQTVFVLSSSKRHLYTRRQEQEKPGREVVTFLMVTNFAMWAIITLEKSRVDAHPVQSQFFGQWPWTIITNISSPLAIFYRYHSTVCLCEIWKRCYKISDRLHIVPHASA